MKSTVPTLLVTHMGLETTNVGTCIRITRADGQIFGLTTFDNSLPINGVTYIPGLGIKSSEMTSGYAVDNLELTLLDDGSLVTKSDALSGVWRNAAFYMFEFNYLSPTDGVNPILAGVFGQIQLNLGFIVIEMRGLQQYLQQNVGNVTSKTCRARFGDSLCTLNKASFTFTGTITAVTGKQVIIDTSRAEADDYFAEGIFTFTSGVCAGLPAQKIKSYVSSTKTFTLILPMIVQFAIGDTYSAVAGCRHRMPEDCITKFNNVLNFQAEPHLPGMDTLTASS
jgi:uncharacterized phage protein (TIGR02218 family)